MKYYLLVHGNRTAEVTGVRNTRVPLSLLATSIFLLAGIVGCGQMGAVSNHPDSPANTAGNAIQTTTNGQSPAAIPGRMAPDFSLESLSDKKLVTLHELLGNGPILLNAWASWCGPCQNETPDLVALAHEYRGKVQFVGINMTSNETSTSDVTKFVQQYHIDYPVLLDPNSTFLNTYNIVGFPTTILISSKGVVLSVHQGSISRSETVSLITQALQGKGLTSS